jgi:hypothetical protein
MAPRTFDYLEFPIRQARRGLHVSQLGASGTGGVLRPYFDTDAAIGVAQCGGGFGYTLRNRMQGG